MPTYHQRLLTVLGEYNTNTQHCKAWQVTERLWKENVQFWVPQQCRASTIFENYGNRQNRKYSVTSIQDDVDAKHFAKRSLLVGCACVCVTGRLVGSVVSTIPRGHSDPGSNPGWALSMAPL